MTIVVPKPHYTDKEKMNAVECFVIFGGNVPRTSAASGVSIASLRKWKVTEWWKKALDEYKQEEKLVLSARLKKVMEKSWDVVEDRMTNGDFVLNNKTGEILRKPVSMKDANKVATDAVMLRDKIDRTEAYTVHADQVEDKLAKLAKAFSDLAKGVKPKEEAEDIEFVERLDEGEALALDDREEREDGEGL